MALLVSEIDSVQTPQPALGAYLATWPATCSALSSFSSSDSVDLAHVELLAPPDGCSMNEHGADRLALVATTGDGEDKDVAAVCPGVLGPLVGDRDNP
jgi:hypothetical protein